MSDRSSSATTPNGLAGEAVAIFRETLAAIDSATRTAAVVAGDERTLTIAGLALHAEAVDSLIVVGAGKAGAGMTRGLLDALPPGWRSKVRGWVNVPADCVPADAAALPVTLHAGRPAGDNNPHPEGIAGTQQIRRLLAAAGPRDAVVVLLSGGGSALLVDPVGTLDQSRSLVAHLTGRGATIGQINAVRARLSRVKGGRLLAGCLAGTVVVLGISDVIVPAAASGGDVPADFQVIASGPTVATDPAVDLAPAVAAEFGLDQVLPPELLARVAGPFAPVERPANVHHRLVATNADAVRAAAGAARQRGFGVVQQAAGVQGEANAIGRSMAAELAALRADGSDRPRAIISGGEPVVRFDAPPGRGGRNQQLVLAALASEPDWERIALLSGGTDGEDGPTDAAGGVVDAEIARRIERDNAVDAARRSDAYPLLDAAGGLVRTGPTHTNVMDVRIGLVAGSGLS